MLYFAVLVIFFSRIIGGMAEGIVSNIIAMKCQNGATSIQEILNDKSSDHQNIIDLRNAQYAVLVFYRHLLLSSFLLGITLIAWFDKKVYKIRTSIIILIICSTTSLCCYFSTQNLSSLKKAIDAKYPSSQCLKLSK